ncbi:glucagon receptor-like [Bombina bombina]|uniref:glucagon receptor-like n=1 Tax=Bombina bombina TaxID=8345 RepID=UPI00235A58BB|nr:glucagon receptor-like [Bombina bombina]
MDGIEDHICHGAGNEGATESDHAREHTATESDHVREHTATESDHVREHTATESDHVREHTATESDHVREHTATESDHVREHTATESNHVREHTATESDHVREHTATESDHVREHMATESDHVREHTATESDHVREHMATESDHVREHTSREGHMLSYRGYQLVTADVPRHGVARSALRGASGPEAPAEVCWAFRYRLARLRILLRHVLALSGIDTRDFVIALVTSTEVVLGTHLVLCLSFISPSLGVNIMAFSLHEKSSQVISPCCLHNVCHRVVILSLSFVTQIAGGQVLQKTFEEWMRYREECYIRLASTPQPEGEYCNRTFDMYACWPDGTPGTIINVSCPYYLPWFQKVSHGLVSRRCGHDGHWVTVNGTEPWRDSSQCDDEMEVTQDEVGIRDLLLSFRALYTVGYSVSLLTLILALLILTMCRKLRCTRNYIHANLFVSFALRGFSVIIKDVLQAKRWDMHISKVSDWETLVNNEATIGCRIAQVVMQYCILANHYWFVVEAAYLYKLLIGAVFSEKNHYTLYLYLGWGTPLLFVVPWLIVKYLKENSECWALNENMAYWWIIRMPILLASLINLLIFMRILKVILSKLRANQRSYADYKLRLAKATLTLIPLFGIHEVVFIFATDEQTSGILRYIKVFCSLFLNSFQGFLVAVLYCFSNKEVSLSALP